MLSVIPAVRLRPVPADAFAVAQAWPRIWLAAGITVTGRAGIYFDGPVAERRQQRLWDHRPVARLVANATDIEVLWPRLNGMSSSTASIVPDPGPGSSNLELMFRSASGARNAPLSSQHLVSLLVQFRCHEQVSRRLLAALLRHRMKSRQHKRGLFKPLSGRNTMQPIFDNLSDQISGI